MKARCWYLLALLVTLITFTQRLSAEGFEKLLRAVPGQANAILLLDADAVRQSALAVQDNWCKNCEKRYTDGLTTLPPSAKRVVLAGLVNPLTLQNAWEVGALQLNKEVSVESIAKAKSGMIDKVGGQPVVLSPDNAYLFPLAHDTVGAMRPANRQAMARWMREVKAKRTADLSPYLQNAASSVGSTFQMILALDLTDVFDLEGVKARLKKCNSLAAKNIDVDALAKTLVGLKGITVSIQVDSSINGELRLDFSESADNYSALLKPLVLEVLGQAALISRSWKAGGFALWATPSSSGVRSPNVAPGISLVCSSRPRPSCTTNWRSPPTRRPRVWKVSPRPRSATSAP